MYLQGKLALSDTGTNGAGDLLYGLGSYNCPEELHTTWRFLSAHINTPCLNRIKTAWLLSTHSESYVPGSRAIAWQSNPPQAGRTIGGQLCEHMTFPH